MSKLSICFQSPHQSPSSAELQLCFHTDYSILLNTYLVFYVISTTGVFMFLPSAFATIPKESVELYRSLHRFFLLSYSGLHRRRDRYGQGLLNSAKLLKYSQQRLSKSSYNLSMNKISLNLIFILQAFVFHEIQSVYRSPAVHTAPSPNDTSPLSHKHVTQIGQCWLRWASPSPMSLVKD